MKVLFDSEKDKFACKCAIRGIDLYFSLCDFSDELRKICKYEDLTTFTATELAERIRNDFFNVLTCRDIDLDSFEG
jgi:hypothetical protein